MNTWKNVKIYLEGFKQIETLLQEMFTPNLRDIVFGYHIGRMYGITNKNLDSLDYRTTPQFKENTIWSLIEKRIRYLSEKTETELNK